MTRKTLLIILTIGLIVSLSGVATSSVLADDGNYHSPIIERLAETFGVNKEEVEAVFDAVREEHYQVMQDHRQNRLQEAVKDGVITEEQLKALEEKHREMWELRNQYHEEMEAWFEKQDIDHQSLMEYMGAPHHGGEFGMNGQKGRFH